MANLTAPERLRFLMVIHTPWSRNLGAPRVQLELGEELTALGHSVEKFSYEDAFPDAAARPGRARLGWGARLAVILRSNRSFAARARSFVAAHADRFDVIDANQTDLPVPRHRLGFSGLLVTRSVGLIPAYSEFERWAARRWPEPITLRGLARNALTYPGRRRRLRDARRSLCHCDLINVSNRADLEAVSSMGLGEKAICLPFGLSDARRAAFRRSQSDAAERLAAGSVVFIGAWNSRKGAKDWPQVVEQVLRRLPGARFRFLGTGYDREHVLREFTAAARSAIDVLPQFDGDELPGLLAGATVGAFPGYLEGFGFGVLEMLAAGLPTVAYDSPGPRDILAAARLSTVVSAGDVTSFSRQLIHLLSAGENLYASHSEDSNCVADGFRWSQIARDTVECYRERLEIIRRTADTARVGARRIV
jgi:glycosyltransferase involved in cell wall biosynthesis